MFVGFHRAHECVGDQDAVVQVQRLAIRVAAGGATDFDEFLDLGVADGEVDGGGASAEGALGDREGQRIHDADEGDDAGGFADRADLLADGAEVAPVGADAAALGGQPDVLVPQADDAFQAVGGLVQEAGNRQAALGAAVRQDRRGGHEPQLRHVVVDALGVAGVVAVVGGDAGEQVLEFLAGHQVAVGQGGSAEIGQQHVTGAIDMDLVATWHLHCVEHFGFPLTILGRVSACNARVVNQHVGHLVCGRHNIHGFCCGVATVCCIDNRLAPREGRDDLWVNVWRRGARCNATLRSGIQAQAA